MSSAPTPHGGPRRLPLTLTPDGWHILRIHYSAIPGYNFEAACEGLSEAQIRQEMEIDWTASANKRVFPEFSEIHIAAQPLRFDRTRPLVCGWDVGLSKTPAWVPTQLLATGQWAIFPPLVGAPDVATGTYDFAEQVYDHLIAHYCKPFRLPYEKLKLIHIGDPAGKARPIRSQSKGDAALELRSAYEILNKGTQIITDWDAKGQPVIETLQGWGWKVIDGDVSLVKRLEAIKARLKMIVNGRAALIVCPTATKIIEGFKGAYHYKQRSDGTYEREPAKNHWSHPMDAIQYVATKLFSTAPESSPDDDEDVREDDFRSHAAGRR